MAELADAPDLGSGGEIHAGSIPVTRTILVPRKRCTPKNPLFIADFQHSKAKKFKCKTVDAFQAFLPIKRGRTLHKANFGKFQGRFDNNNLESAFFLQKKIIQIFKDRFI